MKNTILTLSIAFALILTAFVSPQDPPKNIPVLPVVTGGLQDTVEQKVYSPQDIETQPEFPGGNEAMMNFISEKIKYPKEAKDSNISGRVLISFVIDSTGHIQNIEPLLPKERQLGFGLEEEAIRVIKIMPKWTPGYNKEGKAVSVKFALPIFFQLDKETKKEKKNKKSNSKQMKPWKTPEF